MTSVLRIDIYHDGEGHEIRENVVMVGMLGKVPRFLGRGKLNFEYEDGTKKTQAYDFPINAENLPDAFAKYEATGKESGDRVIQQIMAQQRYVISQSEIVLPAVARRFLTSIAPNGERRP